MEHGEKGGDRCESRWAWLHHSRIFELDEVGESEVFISYRVLAVVLYVSFYETLLKDISWEYSASFELQLGDTRTAFSGDNGRLGSFA